MRVEHLAIDGSVVAIEADADVSSGATAAGWAIVPSLMRAHPFTISPAGHSARVERHVRAQFGNTIRISQTQEFSLKNGKLRVAQVDMPTPAGGTRSLVVGGWEGSTGCLSTSLARASVAQLVEAFDTLAFSESRQGVFIDSPVVTQPRPPELIKEIPRLGVLSIRPAIAAELERVPKARGFLIQNGELFRHHAASSSLLFVSKTSVVAFQPQGDPDGADFLPVARSLRVEWTPRQRDMRVF